jgi:TfoX/Sxy family transcriptional regulator of competence genes
MASDKGTVEYIVEQMGEAGEIRSRPMFGEYGVYCDDHFVALICNDQLFIKASPIANDFLSDDHLAPPYPGAKDAYLVPAERLDDRTWLGDFVRATTAELAKTPAKKRSRSTKQRA